MRSERCMTSVTNAQVRVTEAVVAWYLDSYWMSPSDVGTPAMFFDPELVGHFAIEPDAFEAGEPRALARLLVAVSVFQRLRDQLVLRILHGMQVEHVVELTNLPGLADAARSSPCSASHSTEGLRASCDLGKDTNGRGMCSQLPQGACSLHRHTEYLKRYGHFGKVPTSLALAIDDAGASSLADLYRRTLELHRTRIVRARALESVLCRAWRVNAKIAAMFLSLVCTPGLSRWQPPWRSGIGWERFIVIDSNVDQYLSSIGYSGTMTYDARRRFVTAVAEKIDLRRHSRRLACFNPRLVQQAMYMFAGRSNRLANNRDCRTGGAAACRACPRSLVIRCPVARLS